MSRSSATDADVLWKRGVDAAAQGQMDVAFSNFHLLVDAYPHADKSPGAQFSLGEYYFLQHNFPLAIAEFKYTYSRYPKHKEALFALAYLYKIAQMENQPNLMRHYQKKLVASRRLALVFKNSKSIVQFSGFQHPHTIVFYIDKIEVFKDEKLFIEISY